jgi:hypothetical protein
VLEIGDIQVGGIEVAVQLICPLQSGPSTILVWTLKEKTNGQEARA